MVLLRLKLVWLLSLLFISLSFSKTSPQRLQKRLNKRGQAFTARCNYRFPQVLANLGMEARRQQFSERKIDYRDALNEIPKEERLKVQREMWKLVSSMEDFAIGNTRKFKGKARRIESAEEGLLVKLALMRKATKTIDISTFIFVEDHSGRAILAEAKQAIKRGVRVRLLVDATGSKGLHMYKRALIEEAKKQLAETANNSAGSFEVVIFHPIFSSFTHYARQVYRLFHNLYFFWAPHRQLATGDGWLNRRLHDKLLLIDAGIKGLAYMILGGRNLSDDYHDLPGKSHGTFVDFDIVVKDESISESRPEDNLSSVVERYYDRVWYGLAHRQLQETFFWMMKPWRWGKYKEGLARRSRELDKMTGDAFFDGTYAKRDDLRSLWESLNDGSYFNELKPGRFDFTTEIYNAKRTEAFLDPFNTDNRINPNSVLSHAQQMIRDAKESIILCSPYLFLTKAEIKALQDWADVDPNKRQLIYIANSMAATDNPMTQAYVDLVVAPQFMGRVLSAQEAKERGVLAGSMISKNGWINKKREDGSFQVEVYAFGRLKDIDKDGEAPKLHAKWAVVDGKLTFKEDSSQSLVTTHNGDYRSRRLNLEIGLVVSDSEVVHEMNEQTAQEFIRRSTLWGSKEFHEVRHHPKVIWKTKVIQPLMHIVNKSGFKYLI